MCNKNYLRSYREDALCPPTFPEIKIHFFFQPLLFRYNGELVYPQLSLTTVHQFKLVPGTRGMHLPNVCFIPLVAGPYLEDLPTVMQKIDSIGQDMQKIPYAVFLLGDLPSTGQAATYLDYHMSPAVVSTQVSNIYSYNFTLHTGHSCSQEGQIPKHNLPLPMPRTLCCFSQAVVKSRWTGKQTNGRGLCREEGG